MRASTALGLPSPARTMRLAARLAGAHERETATPSWPRNRPAACDRAGATAPPVAESSRRAGPVNSPPPQTPTTSAPAPDESNLANPIFIARIPDSGQGDTGLAAARRQATAAARRRRRASRVRSPSDPAMIPPAMTTGLTRYILRQCLGVMIFVTAALCAAVWLAQSLRLVDLIVNRGLTAELFLYLALLILPRFIDIVLPIGVFIAVLFVFNRLTSESELVVMRAAGLGPLALARPVLILAGFAFAVLMTLSAYFLPASNREFKDAQFEIRNRFVSSLLQEGSFTTVSDKLTIYIASRDERGEVVGLLIDDERDKDRPVSDCIAGRDAVFQMSPAAAPACVMVDGNRQELDRSTGKLSILTFDRYTLDLNSMRDAPVVRFREPQERFLGELLFPAEDLETPAGCATPSWSRRISGSPPRYRCSASR